MSDCNSCPNNGNCNKDSSSCNIQANPENKIKNIIGVMSGKGGVGKSTVSALLAKQLKREGYSVGIMDADITGPSAARLLGLQNKRAYGMNNNIIPVETEDGIKVISLNLMIDDEDQPVIWRGSLLSNCVKQFWTDVLWGELDYLIIDMPPGTGDVTLTVMQSIPLTGVIMVSIPQDMVSMIVAKSINMAKKLNVNILGLIENMSYIICPCCNEKIKMHDDANIKQFLESNSVKLLAELPTTPAIAGIAENGYEKIINSDIEKSFSKIIKAINSL